MSEITRHSELRDTNAISRREVLRRAALFAGVAMTPELLTFVARAQTPAAKSYLPSTQRLLMSAAVDRILPRTDTPGALDVGVPAFLDRFYGEFMTAEEQKLLVSALDDIEAAAKSINGSPFADLTPAQQDTVLRAVGKAQEGRTPSSFGLLRSTAILGYFSSEAVGKDVLNYAPVPGAYDGCVPIDQVGRRNWTT